MSRVEFVDHKEGVRCFGNLITGQDILNKIRPALYPYSNKINTYRHSYQLVENLRKFWNLYKIDDPEKTVSTISQKLGITQYFVNYTFRHYLVNRQQFPIGHLIGGRELLGVTNRYLYLMAKTDEYESEESRTLDPIKIEFKLQKCIIF